MPDDTISPITGRPAKRTNLPELGFAYSHERDGFADLWITTHLDQRITTNHPIPSQGLTYTPTEKRAALNLIRSYLWRAKILEKPNFIVTTAKTLDGVADRIRKSASDYDIPPTPVLSFESFITEAKALTLTRKAMATLWNIDHYCRNGTGIYEPIYGSSIGSDYTFARREPGQGTPEIGITYGCDETDGHWVYEFLTEKEYIRAHRVNVGSFDGVQVTARGRMVLEDQASGAVPERSVFVVQAYDLVRESKLRPLYDEIEKLLHCQIQPVWGKEHLGKIDEEIFLRIRRSAVIVVDITPPPGKPDRFNIALELGYALALAKPIVLIREKPPEDALDYVKTIPFDIATTNCFTYDLTHEEAEFTRKVAVKIDLAFELAPLRQ